MAVSFYYFGLNMVQCSFCLEVGFHYEVSWKYIYFFQQICYVRMDQAQVISWNLIWNLQCIMFSQCQLLGKKYVHWQGRRWCKKKKHIYVTWKFFIMKLRHSRRCSVFFNGGWVLMWLIKPTWGRHTFCKKSIQKDLGWF